MVDGTTRQLEAILEPVSLPPEFNDAEIKQAIIDISPDAFEGMLQRLEAQGVPRSEVITLLDEFSQGRRW